MITWLRLQSEAANPTDVCPPIPDEDFRALKDLIKTMHGVSSWDCLFTLLDSVIRRCRVESSQSRVDWLHEDCSDAVTNLDHIRDRVRELWLHRVVVSDTWRGEQLDTA
jgi:hypothetical protein